MNDGAARKRQSAGIKATAEFSPEYIDARFLTKDFDIGDQTETVVKRATLSVRPGEIVAFLGRSGSGKSTVLNMLGLLLRPTSGQLFLVSRQLDRASNTEAARFRLSHLGFVFQAFHLVDHLSVRENVELPLRLLRLSRHERRTLVETMLESLGLTHRASAMPATLSGGEKQRVAIARALIADPQVLLCDEPTGNLDSARSDEVMALLREQAERGRAVLVVTHDLAVADDCDRRIDMIDGKVVQEKALADDPSGTVAAAPESFGQRVLVPRASWRVALSEGMRSFFSRFRRNLLTALGVAIGIGTLVVNIGLSTTASAQISDSFNAFLASHISLTDARLESIQSSGALELHQSAALERVRGLNGVKSAGVFGTLNSGTPVDLALVRGQALTEETPSAALLGAAPETLDAIGARLVVGRFFDDGAASRNDRVALIGQGVLDQLGSDWKPGMQIFVNSQPVTVAGVISDDDPNGRVFNSVVVPLGIDIPTVGTAMTSIKVAIHVEPGAAGLVGAQGPLAYAPDRQDQIAAAVPPEPHNLREQVDGTTTALLFVMAAVALIIGAMGITNTFLVAVLERRREIGLRLAIGTTRFGILGQFATEATLLGLLGGGVGVVLGLDLVTVLSVVQGWTPVFDPALPIFGLGLGVLLGLLAGVYPAFRASRVDPIESLSH